jgi:hypothetical protein
VIDRRDRRAAARDLRRMLANLRRAWGSSHPEFVYRGPMDFVLRHGRSYVPQPLPKPYRVGAQKMCFGNAIIVAASYGLAYVEGYALAPTIRFPIHHAWNADADGNLVDTTWAGTGAAYLGVAFALGRADEATWDGDGTVLDDFKRRWPLLREPWTGEHEWPESERIVAIRERRLGHLRRMMKEDAK